MPDGEQCSRDRDPRCREPQGVSPRLLRRTTRRSSTSPAWSTWTTAARPPPSIARRRTGAARCSSTPRSTGSTPARVTTSRGSVCRWPACSSSTTYVPSTSSTPTSSCPRSARARLEEGLPAVNAVDAGGGGAASYVVDAQAMADCASGLEACRERAGHGGAATAAPAEVRDGRAADADVLAAASRLPPGWPSSRRPSARRWPRATPTHRPPTGDRRRHAHRGRRRSD